MIDLYMETKRREQQMLQEAKVRRLLKAAKCELTTDCPKPRMQLLTWLRLYLPAPRTGLQTGLK